MKLYFSILLIYLLISFIVLIKLVDNSIIFYKKSTKELVELNPFIKALLAIWWPLTFYFIYRDRNEKL